MHTGNIIYVCWRPLFNSVYPCAYREHVNLICLFDLFGGLSLCIQGTFIVTSHNRVAGRFIPVHTGNILEFDELKNGSTVYPCAYREHGAKTAWKFIKDGLSLCIQGTFFGRMKVGSKVRFIPVHTGNIIFKDF